MVRPAVHGLGHALWRPLHRVERRPPVHRPEQHHPVQQRRRQDVGGRRASIHGPQARSPRLRPHDQDRGRRNRHALRRHEHLQVLVAGLDRRSRQGRGRCPARRLERPQPRRGADLAGPPPRPGGLLWRHDQHDPDEPQRPHSRAHTGPLVRSRPQRAAGLHLR